MKCRNSNTELSRERRLQRAAASVARLGHIFRPIWQRLLEDEILALQTNIKLKSRAHGKRLNLLTKEKYPNMRKCSTSLTALFGSSILLL